jgi:hypothetical protein
MALARQNFSHKIFFIQACTPNRIFPSCLWRWIWLDQILTEFARVYCVVDDRTILGGGGGRGREKSERSGGPAPATNNEQQVATSHEQQQINRCEARRFNFQIACDVILHKQCQVEENDYAESYVDWCDLGRSSAVCGHSGFDQVVGSAPVGNSQHSGC